MTWASVYHFVTAISEKMKPDFPFQMLKSSPFAPFKGFL